MRTYLQNGEVVQISDADYLALFPQPDDVPAVDPVPSSITPLQARNGLRAWGIGRQQVDAYFATITDDLKREAAEDAWEYATSIDRDSDLIAGCAAFLGKSEADIDQFFKDAVK